MSNIGVLGGGAWGTALANHLARSEKAPVFWVRDRAVFEKVDGALQNRRYLPGIALQPELHPTEEGSTLSECETLLIVIPAQALRTAVQKLKSRITPTATLVLCAKGIETSTGKTMSAVVREQLPENPIAILSGPSFAEDVAQGLPTAVTLAHENLKDATGLCTQLSGPNFRPYASADVIGVEWGGALKNVMALGVGMARGKGLGASAEAALTTRGFAELSRIADYFGAKPETLTGLSGLGDLILTCSSPQSRNFSYGLAVGSGQSLDGLKLAEGVHTTSIVSKLCEDLGLDAPITSAIHAVLQKQIDIDTAMAELFARPLKVESD